MGPGSGGVGAGGAPTGKKLREIIRGRGRAAGNAVPDSDDEEEGVPDVDFEYADEDSMAAELAELYSYTEGTDFQLCQRSYEEITSANPDLPKTWTSAPLEVKVRTVQLLLDQLEVAVRNDRLAAARALLYIGQGCWLECQSDAECLENIKENVVILYRQGVFTSFVELLNLEIENSDAASSALRKLAVSLADSVELRVVLSLLYTMTLILRTHPDQELKEGFVKELNTPMVDNELLAIRLLTMVSRFCLGSAPHFPMKKCLLLLWKVLLPSMGGTDKLRDLKTKYRP